jgi:phosphoribosylanthranilate isomerase
MKSLIKLCGFTRPDDVNAGLALDVDFIGLVCRSDSLRCVSFAQASALAALARGRAHVTVVVADENDDFIGELVRVVRPDVLQLHGSETPQRVSEIKSRFQTAVVKAVGVCSHPDLETLHPYIPFCEHILVEAKAPDGRAHGGSGRAFDWTLLRNSPLRKHIMLAGGLNPGNVCEAIQTAGIGAVDVCSGIESLPGLKDKTKMAQFVASARAAFETLSPRSS